MYSPCAKKVCLYSWRELRRNSCIADSWFSGWGSPDRVAAAERQALPWVRCAVPGRQALLLFTTAAKPWFCWLACCFGVVDALLFSCARAWLWQQGPAATGQLVFLCGGDKELFETAAKDLDLMGKVCICVSHWRKGSAVVR